MGMTASSPSRPTSPRPERRPVEQYVVAVILVLLLVGAGYAIWSAGRTTPPSAPPYVPQTRPYYVAANPLVWNYTPSGTNELTGVPLGSKEKDIYVVPGGPHPLTYLNGTYPMESFQKCGYQQYPNSTFASPETRPVSQAYLGLAGPVLYAAVGDTLQVEFRNNCAFPVSLTAPGLATGSAAPVPEGGTANYTWPVTASAGPGPAGPGSVLRTYTDGAAPTNGTDTGLFGGIVVSEDADADPNGTPADVAANLVLLLGAFNETESPYFAYNEAHYVPDVYALQAGFVRPAINGFIFGNLPMITLTQGEHVRWYVGNVGPTPTVPFWEGNTLVENGSNVVAAELGPGNTTSLDMWTNNSGVWLVESGDPSDLAGGMDARYTVLAAQAAAAPVPAGPSTGATDPSPAATLRRAATA